MGRHPTVGGFSHLVLRPDNAAPPPKERHALLASKLVEQGLREDLAWYLDLRQHGTVPHAGFGIGFERMLQYFNGVANIRDAIPFPRHVGSCRL